MKNLTQNSEESRGVINVAEPAATPTLSLIDRRRFVKGLGVAGATFLPAGAWLFANSVAAAPGNQEGRRRRRLSGGDAAVLRFLAAAELIETDLWQQYNELATGNAAYAEALAQLDEDMAQYVNDNTDDELSHALFLNAYLQAHGADPVNLDAFRTLPSSQAQGAQQKGRLTNLTRLTVDTSWYRRYRSTDNPDFGDTFPQAINIVDRPAIPSQDGNSALGIQAIANVAAFHFATIEQGGSSLYTNMAGRVSNLEVLRIVVSIGGTEVNHFAVWHDKAGNAPHLDTGDGLVFPDLNADPATQTNLIFPEPCKFISTGLPLCSVIRPSSTRNAGALAAAAALTDSGLFDGQSSAFFKALHDLAQRADDAQRDDRD